MAKNILLTIDVEDWFQVENFKTVIPFSTWSDRELRVEKNTHRLLDLLDDITPSNPTNPTPLKATFFILGWIANQLPRLVKEIHARGHEVASHGFHHELCTKQELDELKKDLIDSKNFLEDLIGEPVFGYRAPSFSLFSDALKIIEDCGYAYDSSYNSSGLNERYGNVDFSGYKKAGIAYALSDAFFELPVSNMIMGNRIIPWSGGGYFRLTPFFIFKQGIKKILNDADAYLFYLHPWEIDPDQPRVDGISINYKFRHYVNLNKTYSRFSRLIETFKQARFIPLHQYLKNQLIATHMAENRGPEGDG